MKGSSDILSNLALHHNSQFRCRQPNKQIAVLFIAYLQVRHFDCEIIFITPLSDTVVQISNHTWDYSHNIFIIVWAQPIGTAHCKRLATACLSISQDCGIIACKTKHVQKDCADKFQILI